MGGSKIEFAMTKSTSKNTTPPQDLNIDWMSLFSPCPVNIETQTPEQVKFARRYNLTFWCIYGVLAVAVVLIAFPDIEKMILGPILVLIFFLAFNAIAHSVRIRGRAGRKELAPTLPNTIPSTMKANRVGTPIRAEILSSQMQVRITTTMRMRKRLVIFYPKQMIPAARLVAPTLPAADN